MTKAKVKIDRGALGYFRIKMNTATGNFETFERKRKRDRWVPSLPGPLELKLIRAVQDAISDYEGTICQPST